MCRVLVLCASLACAAALVPGTAHAAHPDVEAAKSAYRNGEFAETLAHLQSAEHSPAATEDDRVAIHWYRAASFHAQGRTDEAAASLDELLLLRPMYTPDRGETPPNLRALFRSRQEAYDEKHGVRLADPVLDGAEISVVLHGHPDVVTGARVFARAPGKSNYTAFELRSAKGAATGTLADAELWEDVAEAGAVELVVEAYNARGALVARHGDALQPQRVSVERTQAATLASALRPAPVVERARPAPAQPAASGTRFTPWMFMGTLSATAFACCSGSCVTGVTLLLVGTAGLVTGTFPQMAALMWSTGGLCCSAGCVSLLTTVLLGACTATLWGAEVYYLGQLPLFSSEKRDDSLESPSDASIE